MQNAFATTTSTFFPPSVRPEIEIHSLDYDFPEPNTRPTVRKGHDAVRRPCQPGKPASAHPPAPSPNVTSLPSYKTPPSPLVARPAQENVIANKTTARSTAKLDAWTFSKAVQDGCHASVKRHIDAWLPLDKGPTANALTPLMQAASQGNETIVRLLLTSGAKVSQPLSNGMTALLYAARDGHTAVVALLLSKRAEINGARSDGTTALMLAARKGHIAVVQLLLSKGASVNAVHGNSMSALEFAVQYRHTDVEAALRMAGAIEQRD
jgi:hypothetical protein